MLSVCHQLLLLLAVRSVLGAPTFTYHEYSSEQQQQREHSLIRKCGRMLVRFAKQQVCASDCLRPVVDGVGLAHKCCMQRCSRAQMRAHCCPNTADSIVLLAGQQP